MDDPRVGVAVRKNSRHVIIEGAGSLQTKGSVQLSPSAKRLVVR